MPSKLSKEDIKLEEKRLFEEYKAKLAELKKTEKEEKAVGQIFTKGLLPIYVMFILSLGATNGNDISHKISERTNGLWTPSTGGIYPLLKNMEKSGWIVGEWDNPKKKTQKIYSLTNLGYRELLTKKSLLKDRILETLEVFNIVYSDLYK